MTLMLPLNDGPDLSGQNVVHWQRASPLWVPETFIFMRRYFAGLQAHQQPPLWWRCSHRGRL